MDKSPPQLTVYEEAGWSDAARTGSLTELTVRDRIPLAFLGRAISLYKRSLNAKVETSRLFLSGGLGGGGYKSRKLWSPAIQQEIYCARNGQATGVPLAH